MRARPGQLLSNSHSSKPCVLPRSRQPWLVEGSARTASCAMTTSGCDLRRVPPRSLQQQDLIWTPQSVLCKWLWHVTALCDISMLCSNRKAIHILRVETLGHESLAGFIAISKG